MQKTPLIYLESIVQNSLKVDARKVFNKFDIGDYDFSTLNSDAVRLSELGYSDIEQASAELIDRAGLHDLQKFINECKG